MAAFSHEVYAYGNVDGLVGIFTAVKLIMGSNDYDQLIQIAVVIGFVVVSIAALNPKHWQKGWAWLLQVAIVSGLAFIPKANVTIIDRLGIEPAQVVADVPYALALLQSVKSNVGDRLTALFETGFQIIPGDKALPSELTYRENGMMFGNKLIAQTFEARFVSAEVEKDVIAYVRNCFMPTVGKPGMATEDAVLNAKTNLWTLMGTTNAALFTTVHVSNTPVSMSCADAYPEIDKKLNFDVKNMIQKMAPAMYPTMTVAMAEAAYGSSVVAAMAKTKLADASATANELVLTGALRNAFGAANAADAIGTNDAAAMLQAFSQSQGTAAMNASMQAEGAYAEQALPIMRNITDALLMAVFPIVVVLLVMSEGAMAKKIAVGYLLAAVWVELWPPMFAVVNYMATNSAARDLAAATAFDGGLTLGNAPGVYGGVISGTAMIGKYLNMVPFLAGALLFGMDRMISGGGMTRAPVDSGANLAGETAKGNANGGNISMDKASLAMERQSAYMRRQDFVNGVRYDDAVTGEYRGEFRTGSNPNTVGLVMDSSKTWKEQSGRAYEAGRDLTSVYERGIDSAYSDVLGLMRGQDKKKTFVDGVAVQDMTSDGTVKEDRRQAAQQVADKLGIGRDSQTVAAIEAQLSASLGIGGTKPNADFVPTLAARLSGGISGKSATSETISRLMDTAVSSLKQTGYARKEEVVKQFVAGDRFEETRTSNKNATKKIEAGLRESVAAKDGASAKYAEASRYSHAAEQAIKAGANATSGFMIELNNYLKLHGQTPGASSYDPKRGRELAFEFMMSSGLFSGDTEDPNSPLGLMLSPVAGQGPLAIAGVTGKPLQPDTLRPVEGNNPLEEQYKKAKAGLPKDVPTTPTNANPVKIDHTGKAAGVLKEAKAAGVDPYKEVNDSGLRKREEEARRQAAAALAAEKKRQEDRENELNDELTRRKNDTSIFHNPGGILGEGPSTISPQPQDSEALRQLTELNQREAAKREAELKQRQQK